MQYTFWYDRVTELMVAWDFEVIRNSQRIQYYKLRLIDTNVPIGYEVCPVGDLNFDGIVDPYDIVICTDAFHSQPRWPKWNAFVDLNQNDVIDIFDIVVVARNYGKTV